MRFNRAKKETVIYNKVNGKEYLITKEDGQSVIAEALIPDTNENRTDPEDTVRITEANCICFRVIQDAPPTDPVGFYVNSEGTLYKDGTPVTEQGELKFESILCTLPGVLFLISQRKDGNVDLYAYRVGIDRFTNIISDIPSPRAIKVNDTEYAFVYSLTHTEVKEDGNEVCILNKAGVVFVNMYFSITCGTLNCSLGDPFAVDEGTLFFIKKDQVNADGILEEIQPCTLSVSDNDLCDGSIVTETYGIVADQAKYCMYGGLLLIGKDELLCHNILIKNERILSYIREGRYYTVVDRTKKDEGVLLTLSSDDYRVMTLFIRNTSDRGQIVKIVED